MLRDRNLRAGRDQGDIAAALRFDHNISAERDLVGVAGAVAESWHRLPRQTQHRRTALRPQRAIPGFRSLDGVAGAEYQKMRYRPQRSQLLDRLMGGTILAEADRIVRHHMDDAY